MWKTILFQANRQTSNSKKENYPNEKNTIFDFFSLILVSTLCVPSAFAQDSPQFHLPEGAKVRLGKGSIGEIQYSPDGTRLAVAGGIGIWLYDAQTGEELDLLTGHKGSLESVSFSPDGRTLASGSSESIVYLWEVETGDPLHTITGHTGSVNSVSFSPDGITFASGSSDGTVRLWDVATGKTLHTLIGHTHFVTSVSFSPDGRTLASGSWDKTLRLWDVGTGRTLTTFTGHTSWITSVSISLDGTTLASGASYDKTIRLWNVNTGKPLHTLAGHTGSVNSVVFSPDGTTLASGSSDGTIHLWDIDTGRTLTTLTGHTNDVYSVWFSTDGTTLASASFDGTSILWDMSSYMTPITPPESLTGDVNQDGVVNIQDLVLVASNLGKTGQNAADVNSDGVVNIQDLVLVAGALGSSAPATPLNSQPLSTLTAADVKSWLSQARQLNLTDATSQQGILFLRQLLEVLTPKQTALLANFPNPFNPETWIPYNLTKDTEVTLNIYAVNGTLVRTLFLGHQATGMYLNRSRAAHWDGRNDFGEKVASGVYFYTLTAGDFTATRKMLIRK